MVLIFSPRRFVFLAVLLVMLIGARIEADALAYTQFTEHHVVDLGYAGHDVVYDHARDLAYVSIPSRNEVTVVSTQTYSVIDRVLVGSRPLGMDLSEDGQSLYIALNQAAAVARMDTQTRAVEEIFVGTQLGHSLAYDVAEAQPGRVFVSASPGSSGFAYIAMIDANQGDQVTRVASNRIIRAQPTFIESPIQDRLYIGEGFSPNSLYALDLSQASAPIVAEDQHGQVSGTSAGDVSLDGTRIYLHSGQVLRSDNLFQAGRLDGYGRPAVSPDGAVVYMGYGKVVEVYDPASFLKIDAFLLPSGPSTTAIQFLAMEDNRGLLTLRGNNELVITVPEPASLALLGLGGLLLARRRRA